MWKCLACGKCSVFAQTPVSSWFPLGKVLLEKLLSHLHTHSFTPGFMINQHACFSRKHYELSFVILEFSQWLFLIEGWVSSFLEGEIEGRELIYSTESIPRPTKNIIAGTVLPSICPIEIIAIQHLTLSVGQLNLSMIVKIEWHFEGYVMQILCLQLIVYLLPAHPFHCFSRFQEGTCRINLCNFMS